MNRDPVCGMAVSSESSSYYSDYRGTRYYFCSEDCKQRFDQNPERFQQSVGESTSVL